MRWCSPILGIPLEGRRVAPTFKHTEGSPSSRARQSEETDRIGRDRRDAENKALRLVQRPLGPLWQITRAYHMLGGGR